MMKGSDHMTDSLRALVRVVSRHPRITAGNAGFELWSKPADVCRPENNCSTMFCRPAGKLLAKAERMGLVRHEQHGKTKVWYVTDEGREV